MAQLTPKVAVTPKLPAKPEELWHEARLIPTTGIGGQEDQEQRATYSLLAVLRAVPEFGHAVLGHAGAPAGHIRTFTEVRFPDEDRKAPRPDGAIVVEWGKARWVALLEVKTGGAPLRAEQLNLYLEIARAQGYAAVMTISNQLTASPAESPVSAEGGRLKKVKSVALRHLSWWQILTEARLQQQHHAIGNSDQAWVLGELIAYLESGRAGTGGFDDMGDRWVAVREGARAKTLRAADAGVTEVAARWEQLSEFLALGLTQDLGRRVVAVWPKYLDVAGRLDLHRRSLVETGQLRAALRVPDAVGPLEIEADLRTRRLTTSVVVDAPGEGKPKTRITWLLRQLKDAPDLLRIEVHYPNVRDGIGGRLSDLREKPERLLLESDPRRDPRTFRLMLARDLGTKRGNGAGSFVSETQRQTVDFYRSVVQHLRPWRPPAPRLAAEEAEPAGDADTVPAIEPEPAGKMGQVQPARWSPRPRRPTEPERNRADGARSCHGAGAPGAASHRRPSPTALAIRRPRAGSAPTARGPAGRPPLGAARAVARPPAGGASGRAR